jgi:GxxExxY protein
VVEQTVVLEIKTVESLHPIHEAQLLTYLKLGGWPIGLLIARTHEGHQANGE